LTNKILRTKHSFKHVIILVIYIRARLEYTLLIESAREYIFPERHSPISICRNFTFSNTKIEVQYDMKFEAHLSDDCLNIFSSPCSRLSCDIPRFLRSVANGPQNFSRIPLRSNTKISQDFSR